MSACNRATEIVWVHSHGQCSFCKTNIDQCCSGETAEREGGSPLKKKIPQNNLQRWKEDTFFALIWVYATSFAFGSKLNLSRFMTGGSASKGKSSKGYNILFTSSMKRTFCDANKVRLRIADRTKWRFEFCFSFWVFIRLISFLREGGSPLNESVEIGREATGLRNLWNEKYLQSTDFRKIGF